MKNVAQRRTPIAIVVSANTSTADIQAVKNHFGEQCPVFTTLESEALKRTLANH